MFSIILFSLFLSKFFEIGQTLGQIDQSSNSILSANSKRIISDAIFQSEPIVDPDFSNSNVKNPIALRAQQIIDTEDSYVNQPKVQYYPKPQNNYGNYGGYRPNSAPLGYSYIGYINRQSRRYPVMMYTLIQCVPCQRAKHLLAVNYGDVPSHFLELVGDEDWQRQLQVDLLKVTRQATFPYVFVCGQFIGGSSDLFNLHHSGQLRQMLNNCNARG